MIAWGCFRGLFSVEDFDGAAVCWFSVRLLSLRGGVSAFKTDQRSGYHCELVDRITLEVKQVFCCFCGAPTCQSIFFNWITSCLFL
jgi:hypothetical protein